MGRGDEHAFPVAGMQAPNDNFIWPTGGLTIREHFAATAMQGMLAARLGDDCSVPAVAESAIQYADALIAELAKPATPQQASDYRERVARTIVSAASGLNERSIPEAVVSVDAKSDELYQIVLIALEQVKP